MIVLDASFLVKLVVDEEGSREARSLVRSWINEGEKLSTLDIALAEALNALWKHASKIRDIDEESALSAARDLLRIWRLLEVHQSASIAEDAFRLALESNTTIYDSLYIQLAIIAGARLATFDAKQAEVAKTNGITTLPH